MCTQSKLNEILDRTVAEAKLLLDNGEYRGAANRAYYAASKADVETQYPRAEKLVAEIAAYLSGKDKAAQ